MNRQSIAIVLCLAIAVLAAYANSFRVPFLLDDRLVIAENPSLQPSVSFRDLIFPPATTPVSGRPVVNLSFALNHALGGGAVGGYHGFNLTVHLLSGLVLFGLIRRTLLLPRFRDRFSDLAEILAALVAAMWLLHPLQTESVTYVSQRAESIMGLFYLLTFYGFVRGHDSPAAGVWPVLSIVTCCLGMLTKQVMVTAPVLVLLFNRAVCGESFVACFKQRPKYYAGLAASWLLLILSLALAPLSHRSVGFDVGVSASSYALTQLKVVVNYAWLALWPHPLVFDYGSEMLAASVREALPFAAVVLVVIASAAIAWRKSVMAAFFIVSFFVLLAPTSSVVPIAMQPMAESRMYLPLLPVMAALVFAAYRALGRRVIAPFVGSVVAFGLLASARNTDYRSELAIWTDTAAKRDNSSRAHYELGRLLARDPDKRSEAIEHDRRAIQINPNYFEAHNNLGARLRELPGGQAEAILHYEKALAINPNYAPAHYNLGIELMATPGRRTDAIFHYQQALKTTPTDAAIHNNLGVTYFAGGQVTEAIAEFQEALRLDPQSTSARDNLAKVQANRPR